MFADLLAFPRIVDAVGKIPRVTRYSNLHITAQPGLVGERLSR